MSNITGENLSPAQMRDAIHQQLGPPVRYEPKIVAFLDILGFRSLLENEKKLTELASQVRMLNEVFATNQDYKTNGSVLQISDGIIISSEILDLNALDLFLRQIMLGVESLVYLGVPIRGAITYGLHYHKDPTLVSPAFVKAYEMEREVAKYPRVVIDMSVVERQRELVNQGTEITDLPLNKYAKLDRDGYRFVHFMKAALDARYDERRPPGTPPVGQTTLVDWSLKMVRKMIEEGFEKAKSDSVRAKYVWLANYYNESMRTDLGLDRQEQGKHEIECKYLEIPDPRNPNL